MNNDKSSASSFTSMLASYLNEAKANANHSRASSSSSSFCSSPSTSSGIGSTSTIPSGTASVSNPFFKGNLSSADQDRLKELLKITV